jgi:hypothetical protein
MEAMSEKKKNDLAALDRLAAALVEDILNASDEDILAEAQEDHIDPDKAVAVCRAQFEEAAARVAKKRLADAKTAIARTPASSGTNNKLDPVEARRRLERVLARDPSLMLAARNGQGIPDDDVPGMLEDLKELGLSSDADEP